MKRVGIVFLALLLLLTGLPLSGRAAEPMKVYAGEVSGTYEDVLTVPVRVQGNSGLMGYSLELSYDVSVLTPVAVKRGETWGNGLFDHNLESATGILRVVWSATEPCYGDGVLFTVDFAVKGEAYGSYPMELRCNMADTFNGAYERLDLPCVAGQIILEKDDTSPLLYSGSYSATMGEALEISLRITNNSGVSAGIVSLLYNADALLFVEARSALAEVKEVSNQDGKMLISIGSVDRTEGDGVLFKLSFRAKYCEGKTYALQWSFTGGINCHDAKVSIQKGDARIYGSQVQIHDQRIRIPVWIAGNPGLMGLKLSITYDPSFMKFESLTRGELMSEGMFSHNMDTEGRLLFVWSGTEDITEDGELFLLEFSKLRDLDNTYIRMKYSQADTFNSGWKDVTLVCEDIVLSDTIVPPEDSQDPSCDGGETCPTHNFTDVPSASYWSHAGIDYVVEKGLMVGVSQRRFDPQGKFTRAMMVMVLYRMENSPKVERSNIFTDVSEKAWYADAVTWASKTGVVKGYNDGSFRPDEPITREQIAVMFYRYAMLNHVYEEELQSKLDGFPDGTMVSSWAKAELNWAVNAGLITGVGKQGVSYLLPQDHATREQLATILMRFLIN